MALDVTQGLLSMLNVRLGDTHEDIQSIRLWCSDVDLVSFYIVFCFPKKEILSESEKSEHWKAPSTTVGQKIKFPIVT